MTHNSKPLVSVIMAVHNGSAWIEQAIGSVIAQSYQHLELLVINDGSDDGTEEVILPLASSDLRIRYFKQKHTGVSAARNVGLRHMLGSFFMFLDADDCLTETSIELRMLMFQRHDNLSFCDGPVTVFDSALRKPVRYWRPTAKGRVFKRLIGISESCFFAATWLIRRDFSVKYFFQEDMTHAEDLFFFMEISRMGRYDAVDQTILEYRLSPNSAMRNLKGLAKGYKSLYSKAVQNFRGEITLAERICLWIKIRKIITLSFLSQGNFVDACLFLVMGNVR